ncbi:MAG: hypothetical protein ACRCYY_13755 [Trueperaceae bacterium]
MLKEIDIKTMDAVVGGDTQFCVDLVLVEICVDKEDLVEAANWIQDVTESPVFVY